jgi:hypothetical protein
MVPPTTQNATLHVKFDAARLPPKKTRGDLLRLLRDLSGFVCCHLRSQEAFVRFVSDAHAADALAKLRDLRVFAVAHAPDDLELNSSAVTKFATLKPDEAASLGVDLNTRTAKVAGLPFWSKRDLAQLFTQTLVDEGFEGRCRCVFPPVGPDRRRFSQSHSNQDASFRSDILPSENGLYFCLIRCESADAVRHLVDRLHDWTHMRCTLVEDAFSGDDLPLGADCETFSPSLLLCNLNINSESSGAATEHARPRRIEPNSAQSFQTRSPPPSSLLSIESNLLSQSSARPVGTQRNQQPLNGAHSLAVDRPFTPTATPAHETELVRLRQSVHVLENRLRMETARTKSLQEELDRAWSENAYLRTQIESVPPGH